MLPERRERAKRRECVDGRHNGASLPAHSNSHQRAGTERAGGAFCRLADYSIFTISPPNCTKLTFGGRSASKPNTAGAVRQTLCLVARLYRWALANSWAGAQSVQVSYILSSMADDTNSVSAPVKGVDEGSVKIHLPLRQARDGVYGVPNVSEGLYTPPPQSPL